MNVNTENNKRIAKNTLFLYFRMLVALLLTLYTTRVLLSSFGEIDYGVYNVVAGVVAMFAFLNASLTACIQRFYNFEHGLTGDIGMNKVFITSCFIQVLLSIVVIILAETLGLWYMNNILVVPDDRLEASLVLYQCTVVSLVLVILQVPYSSAIMAYEKMDYYAYVGIIDVVLKLVIAFIITYNEGDRLILYGFLLIGVSLVDFILYYAYVKFRFKAIHFRYRFDVCLFKSMLSFAGWSMFGSFAMVMRNQGLSMILNAFLGPIVNAARGISYQIKGGLVGFINNISTATRPQVVEAYAQNDLDRSTRLTFASTKICYYLLYMMALPVSYEINYILHLWLGMDIPENTAIFSILILVIALIDGLNPPITTLIYATGNNGRYNLLTSLIGLLILPLSYIALKLNMHPAFVYVASIIVSVFVQVASMWCLQDVAGIHMWQYTRSVLIPCGVVTVATILLPFLVLTYFDPSFIRLLLTCMISVISICGACYFLGLDKSEKIIIKSMISNILMRVRR